MPDKTGNLYLYEAIELRNEYDRYIKLLENLVKDDQNSNDSFFRSKDEEQREPASDFNQKEIEDKLKKIQTRRVKLNQAIQVANFKYQIDFDGEKISIAEALEIRKNFIADIEAISKRVINSAYKRVIHKEGRDIVHEPKHLFRKSFDNYLSIIKKIRNIITQIHIANHDSVINFREE